MGAGVVEAGRKSLLITTSWLVYQHCLPLLPTEASRLKGGEDTHQRTQRLDACSKLLHTCLLPNTCRCSGHASYHPPFP